MQFTEKHKDYNDNFKIKGESSGDMEKPVVLFIGPYPPPYSGPELGMKLFLESSLKDAFTIRFLKTNVRKSNVNKGRFDHKMVIAFFRFIFKLLFMLFRYRPAIAYYPITPTQIGWIGRDAWCLLLCRFFGAKTIIHLRGSHLKLNFLTFHPLTQKLVKLACKTVSLALVQASCLIDQFEGLVAPEKLAVLYQAIDVHDYDNIDICDYSSAQILFMGHMTQAKGYCDLVNVIPKVAEKIPDVKFLFAGTLRKGERGVFFNQHTGERLIYVDPFDVHDIISSGPFQKNYKYLGAISGKEKIEILKKIDIFVLPSYSEGFSRAMLEAMSMGKPVIITPVGAHKEVVEEGINGFLVEPGDSSRLAGCINQLIENREIRNNIASMNYKLVREKFAISVIAMKLEHYFKQVINETY